MDIKRLLIMGLLSFGILSNAQENSVKVTKVEEKETNQTRDCNKSMYDLAINSKNCYFIIKVNDVIVFRWENGDGGAAVVSINSILLSEGMQQVTAEMYPTNGKNVFGKNAMLFIDIISYPKNNFRERITLKALSSLDKMENSINDISEKSNFTFSDTFTANNLPYQCEGWKTSIDLSKEDAKLLHQDLYDAYKSVYTILHKKDVEAFLEITKEREELINKMNCLNDTDIDSRNNKITTTIEARYSILLPFPDIKNTHLFFEGNGHLVTLLNNQNRSIIQYKDKNDNFSSLDFRFYRTTKNGSLKVIL